MAGRFGSKIRARQGSVDDLVRSAESAVENLLPAYEKWAAQDLERLKTAFESSWSNAATRDEGAKAMRKIAHDMKGQGTTFGYPLCSEAAGQLCRYLDVVATGAQSAAIIHRHIEALAAVLGDKLKGDGGAEGARIRAMLETLSAHVPTEGSGA